MNDVAFVIIAVGVVAALGFLIPAFIELRKTMKRLNAFLDTAEREIPPTIEELKQTLENMKKITGDVQSVTGGIREITGALTDTADNVRSISRALSRVGTETNAAIAGLKTGVKTAVAVFFKNLVRKGG
ncbi:MAG TPA: DUF948 domain-containing protein [Nitrospirae bacterium]|nr:DUF948 domain-containing protein [Nitrospirota bacterium]